MSLRDLTSGSCAGGSASGGSSSAAGGPLSALASRVVDGTGAGPHVPGSSTLPSASEVNALVHGSLNSTLPPLHEEDLLSSQPPLPAEFAGLPRRPSRPAPPVNLPQFFPPNFLRPFAAVPEPDPHAATAEFEAAFIAAGTGPVAPLRGDDPLVRAQRDRTRQLFPGADEAFIEHQVRQFMADLTLHGRPPVVAEPFKHRPPLHFHAPPPPPHPLPFLYPPALHPGVPPPQHRAAHHDRNSAASAARRNEAAATANGPMAERKAAENLVDGAGADTALRDSVFQEFMELLRGGGSAAGGAAELGSPIERGADLSAERSELDAFESRELHALSNAQRSWGDEFTSLESFTASPSAAERALEESWASGGHFEEAFHDTYATDVHAYLGGDPAQTEYLFERENEFAGRSAADALAEGERLRDAGELARALDAFEAAINRPAEDPHPPLEEAERARAWLLLGTTHAECDDDVRAIQALTRVPAVERGPSDVHDPARTRAAAALALAVSYTNELDATRAYVHLRRWLALQRQIWGEAEETAEVLFDAPDAAEFGEEGYAGDQVAMRLLRRLKDAARRHSEEVEAQIALGVFHSLGREYTEAAAAFRCAVSMRSDDARLWNKLGATLANGGESDDALRSYRRAVDICPRYTRAWVNVGTAYGNRGEQGKAVRYYLRALAATKRGEEEAEARAGRRTPMDDMGHVWGYLRSALYAMDMPELVLHAEERNLDAFRTHFQF